MPSRFRAALLGSTALMVATAAHSQDAQSPPDKKNEVVVTAPRREQVARQVQFAAPNLVNVQAADTIIKYPDFNAAEALGRIPGVSISTDTGEGRFVNIRGIDGNLAGATFGGVPLLNTNPGGTYFGGGGRAVEYDTIPTGSIDGIIVTKTPLPDHEAESLGGTVELTPRTATDVTAPFLDATAGWGYENMHDHAGPLNLDLAVGARFGVDGGRLATPEQASAAAPRMGFFSNPTPFSFVLTVSWREDRRGFDDIEEDYNDPTVDRSYQDLQLRQYNYHRRRFGYGGEFDFQPNDDHAWYLRANVAGYTESVKKNRLTYDFSNYTPTIDPSDPSGFSTQADIDLASTDEQETHRNQVYVFGGKDDFSGVILDYRASYSRATYDQTRNYGAKFQGPTGIPVTYDNSANNGNFPSIIADTALINDPTQYSPITDVGNSTEHDIDQERAYAVNLLVPVDVFSNQDDVKLGGEARLRDKIQNQYNYDDVLNSPLSLANASEPATTDFYFHYTNGPNINIAAVRQAAQAGTQVLQSGSGVQFTAKEDIFAGYGEYEAHFGRLTAVAGVRVEATQAEYGGIDDVGDFVVQPENYTNVFPSVQLRYQIQPNMLVRAIYSTGVGRPGFLQNTRTQTSNFDPTDPQISQGNPSLKPTTGQNFDVDFEYYLPRGGILQIGAFDKEFSNYIVTEYERRLYNGTDPLFQGLIVGYTTYANRPDAYARGLEAAYHQQFAWLPGFWNGFGVDANVTLVDSRILEYDAATSAISQNEYGLLPGTSRLTWNVAGFYEKDRIQLRLAAEYVSKELFSLGGTKSADTIQDDRLTMDFTSSYQFTKNWAVYFNVKNLLDTPLRFYVDQPSFPIQREFYEQTFEAGLRAKF